MQWVWIETWAERLLPSWQFKSLIRGISSGFPLASHFDFSGSQSVFDVSQDPPMCAQASLSQDEFYCKGLWVMSLSWHNFHLTSKKFFCTCVVREVS